MQSVKHKIWTSTYKYVRVCPHQRASTSQCQWDSRRSYAWTPLGWFRQQLVPRQREKDVAKEVEEAKKSLKEAGALNVFEDAEEDSAARERRSMPIQEFRTKATQHKYSTGTLKTSHRKLNLLAHQIAQKPVDFAILQMTFSQKRPSNRVKSMLVVARNHATEKGLARDKLVIAEAWVNKGPGGKANKILEPKGRMKMGIRQRYYSRMHVVLKEGLSNVEKKKLALDKKVKKVASAGVVREDVPLRNPAPTWAW